MTSFNWTNDDKLYNLPYILAYILAMWSIIEIG